MSQGSGVLKTSQGIKNADCTKLGYQVARDRQALRCFHGNTCRMALLTAQHLRLDAGSSFAAYESTILLKYQMVRADDRRRPAHQ